MRGVWISMLAISLVACGNAGDDPGAVSPQEAQELNDAAAALDMNAAPAADPADDSLENGR